MPKPFGKPVRSGWEFTRGARFAAAVFLAALPAYPLAGWAANAYPTLVPRPFFWGSALLLAAFYAIAGALWLRRRPSPRPPGQSSRAGLFAARFFLVLLAAAPAALASAFLYDPALRLANGLLSFGPPFPAHAMLEKRPSGFVLASSYWGPDFHWPVAPSRPLPPDAAGGSLAILTLRRGALGAPWVEKIELEPFK
jgi:hypothetical protein